METYRSFIYNDWLKNKNKMPKEYEEKGLKYI